MADILGIDVGGSGIKGAIVNLETGEFTSGRERIPMPEGGRPADVAKTIQDLVHMLNYTGAIGCGFPTLIIGGVALSAANIDKSWINMNVEDLFCQATGQSVYVLNDADAAGLAEMMFGIGKNMSKGVVLFLTIGTGIGSAIFLDGKLLPNTEFGHIQIRGKDGEARASDAARKRKYQSWKRWAKSLQEYLTTMEALISPDVIILGGGVSKTANEFLPFLHTRAKILPAQLQNRAGIIGAASYASLRIKSS
jgi:polyphosphate glucokinase